MSNHTSVNVATTVFSVRTGTYQVAHIFLEENYAYYTVHTSLFPPFFHARKKSKIRVTVLFYNCRNTYKPRHCEGKDHCPQLADWISPEHIYLDENYTLFAYYTISGFEL